jgi:hypothetical protein
MIYKETLISHYGAVWGRRGIEIHFTKGPVNELPKGFSVLEFAPYEGRDMWTYATCCMSEESDDVPIELHIFSPVRSEEVVELLTITAHYHRTGSKLGLGHSVNFGKPWLDNSGCEFGLISLPYLDGPELEDLSCGGKNIKFYWLIPIFRNEVEYKKENGLEKLEEKLEAVNFNYLDPKRGSVV